jgi:ribosomal-protein-alanine N-acetyltransferase
LSVPLASPAGKGALEQSRYEARADFPVLTTERLELRPVQSSDGNFYHQLLSVAEVTRFSDLPDTATRTQADRFVDWMSKLFSSGSGCAWLIQKRSTGTPLGAIRINRIHKQWRWGEIGYESNPEFWGRGLMTEAVRAVVACGHGHFKLNRMEAWTLPGNDASDRVLVKAGFNRGHVETKGLVQGGLSRLPHVWASSS